MGLKDLALFKLVSSAAKKTKEKVVASMKHNASDGTGESVQETFKAALKKDKHISQSDTDTTEKSTPKAEETLKSEEIEAAVEKSAPVKKAKATQTAAKKTTAAKKAKPAEKKESSKEAAKVEVEKSAPVKKSSTEKAKPAKKEASEKKASGSKREEKIKLYSADIEKHIGSVDDSFLAIVVKNLGPSIYKKDSELVSCSDSKELDTVRNNFLVKKLGFDKSEKEMLDGEIQKVCETLKGTRTKYRATFYYLLAKNLKKESALS